MYTKYGDKTVKNMYTKTQKTHTNMGDKSR